MEQILKDFGIQPILLAAQIVNFLVLLYLLKRFLYKPILKVLEERKEKIAESLKNAQEIEKRLLKTEEDKEKVLNKAALESKKIVEAATKSADQIIKDAHLKATEDMQAIVEKGKATIKLEGIKMQQATRENLAELVATALTKVTGKVINKKEQKEMIEKTVRQM